MQIPDPFKTPQNRHVDQTGHADHDSEVRSAAHMKLFPEFQVQVLRWVQGQAQQALISADTDPRRHPINHPD